MSNSSQFNYILVIEAEDFRKKIELGEHDYSIGRSPDNGIVIPSKLVSRHHATLLRREDTEEQNYSYWIMDGDLKGNKSRNGLYVNGIKIISKPLKDQDVIQFSKGVTAQFFKISNSQVINTEALLQAPVTQEFQQSSNTHQTLIINDDDNDNGLDPQNLSLKRLASFPELIPNPIVEINFEGEITYLNPAAILQFPELTHRQQEHPLLHNLVKTNHNIDHKLWTREVKIKNKVFEQHIHYLPEQELIRSYIFDISDRKLSEEILKYQAFHDLLTDLPNRMLFQERLTLALENAQSYQHQLALLFVDLDRFKNINDTLGHGIGDQLLRAFAQRLKGCLAPEDTLARWGADEFTVLLPKIQNSDQVTAVCQKIINTFQTPFVIEEHQIHLKNSIGIAFYPDDAEDGETLLRHANAALYRSKDRGRNQYQFYTSTMTSDVYNSLKLETLLHQALDKDELLLYYQPQVNIKTGKVEGVEALVRWNNSELGMISPAHFIPLAEETGLILNIGEWVLKEACKQAKAWQNSGLAPLTVSVNLSAQQFRQANLLTNLINILEQTGLEPQFLELEITETSIIHDIDFARQLLDALRAIGIQTSMDDFGTGYSSLGYLKKFPFHTLKIDQSFVRDLQYNSKDLAIIEAIMVLARGFNLRVIAEGVETKEQLQLLQGFNCETIQGYLFSKPLPVTDLVKFLQQEIQIPQFRVIPSNCS